MTKKKLNVKLVLTAESMRRLTKLDVVTGGMYPHSRGGTCKDCTEDCWTVYSCP